MHILELTIAKSFRPFGVHSCFTGCEHRSDLSGETCVEKGWCRFRNDVPIVSPDDLVSMVFSSTSRLPLVTHPPVAQIITTVLITKDPAQS